MPVFDWSRANIRISTGMGPLDQRRILSAGPRSLYTNPKYQYGNLPYNGVTMAKLAQTTARLEARLPTNVHALLKRAAEIEGRTLTDFVVSAARAAATRTIEQAEIIRLSIEDQRLIAKALLNPPEPTRALKRAFQRRRELLGAK